MAHTTTLGPGQPLRGDRIHSYVTAYCPQCHDPDAPLTSVQRTGHQMRPSIWLAAPRMVAAAPAASCPSRSSPGLPTCPGERRMLITVCACTV